MRMAFTAFKNCLPRAGEMAQPSQARLTTKNCLPNHKLLFYVSICSCVGVR